MKVVAKSTRPSDSPRRSFVRRMASPGEDVAVIITVTLRGHILEMGLRHDALDLRHTDDGQEADEEEQQATTRRVDLSNFKEGDKVEFVLKKGRDNRFRITEMKSAN